MQVIFLYLLICRFNFIYNNFFIGTGNIDQLLELEGNDYICSLAWMEDGNCLAIGTTQGTVELWDCTRSKRLRIMNGHSARVGSLAWNSFVLTSGCRSGQIIHHDVRQRDHILTTIAGSSFNYINWYILIIIFIFFIRSHSGSVWSQMVS